MRKKIVFIIPGFKHTAKQPEYQTIAKAFKAKNFEPIILEIPWKKNTMSDYVDYFLKKYTEYSSCDIYTLGFHLEQ